MSRTVRWYALGDFMPGNRRVRAERWVRAFLSRLGVLEHPGFRLDLGLEGYQGYAFGARVGPSLGLSGIAHELAHAVEFGPDAFEQRCNESGFLFHTPRVFICGQLCENFTTGQASERELRTFAIERRLLEMAGLRVSENAFCEQSCRVLGYMPDWIEFHDKPARVRKHLRAAREQFPEHLVRERLMGWLDKTAECLRAAQGAPTPMACQA